MSDKSVTAANVVAGANAVTRVGTAGATITAGQAVYEDSSDSFKFKLADNNASAATAKVAGIALHGASSGQPLKINVEDDDFTPGFTVDLSAAGDKGAYALSATAGGICPVSDLASGNYPVYLMTGKSSTKVILKMVRGTAALTA
jgi:hypothetical protein